MNTTIESIVKYYISKLDTDNIAPEERDRLEDLLQQYFIQMLKIIKKMDGKVGFVGIFLLFDSD